MTIRTLHLFSSYTAGGAEKMIISLCRSLQAQGIASAVACPEESYLYAKALKDGVKAYPLEIRGSFDPVGIFRLWRIVRKERVNILHVHQGKLFWPAVIVKLLQRPVLKVIFHRRTQLTHKFYSRIHYRWADGVIAISQAVARVLKDRDKVDPAKIRVIYNGCDFCRFRLDFPAEELRQQLGLGERTVIGTVGAMNYPKGKGQAYLLRAAKLLESEFPEARYLIVGKGQILDELKGLSARLGLQEKAVFADYQEEVEKYIAAMDIFCLLSWDTEAFGQVMVEAQSMGKPVIGTSIGGIPETFLPGVTGCCVPPEDPETLARTIAPLLRDPARRRQMGTAAAQYVRSIFSIESMAKETIAVYRGVRASERRTDQCMAPATFKTIGFEVHSGKELVHRKYSHQSGQKTLP